MLGWNEKSDYLCFIIKQPAIMSVENVSLLSGIKPEIIKSEMNRQGIECPYLLKNIKGLTPTQKKKFAAIIAVHQAQYTTTKRVQITGSRDCNKEFLSLGLASEPREVLAFLFLRRNNTIIAKEVMFTGSITGCVMCNSTVFKRAIELGATNIVMAHNHPSGALKPSEADIRLTRKTVESGKVLDIQIIDHLIITTNGYYSFADEGML